MMRSLLSSSRITGVRAISGVAPVLYFGNTEVKAAHADQVKRNTAVALELIKKFKGPVPAPYKRKYTQTFDQLQKDVEGLLGGAEKIRRKVNDDQPMDKLSVIERCLRHAVWQYVKDEKGKPNFGEMHKWIVYTQADEARFNALRHEAEQKEKYAAYVKKQQEAGIHSVTGPTFDWQKEYSNAIDREVVVEKRLRYDVLAANTQERDEAAVEALLEKYRRPAQDERLDGLVELLEKFKPVLAREAIMQRLTIKHLEGQLGVWRYLDWNPEVRDRCESEADNYMQHWWCEFEEKRLHPIRLRSKNEVREVMEKTQSAKLAATASTTKSSAKGGDNAREKLLQEVLRLQARIGKREEAEAKKDDDGHGHGHGKKGH